MMMMLFDWWQLPWWFALLFHLHHVVQVCVCVCLCVYVYVYVYLCVCLCVCVIEVLQTPTRLTSTSWPTCTLKWLACLLSRGTSTHWQHAHTLADNHNHAVTPLCMQWGQSLQSTVALLLLLMWLGLRRWRSVLCLSCENSVHVNRRRRRRSVSSAFSWAWSSSESRLYVWLCLNTHHSLTHTPGSVVVAVCKTCCSTVACNLYCSLVFDDFFAVALGCKFVDV